MRAAARSRSAGRQKLSGLRGCGCSGIGALSLPASSTTTTADYAAALQSQVNSLNASAKAQINSITGSDANTQRISQGASSAQSLIQNGYNPDSSSDNQNLVHVISGGLCLVPGVGPLLGGAVEALWVVGNAVEAPLQNALASIGLGFPTGLPPCKTSGSWTPATIFNANKGALPAMPSGSFAQLAVAALATAASMRANCQATPPAAAVVDAIVSMWNQTHQGPAAPYYVPSLLVQPGTLSAAPSLLLSGAGAHVSGTTAAAKAGQVFNVFYAFGPLSAPSKVLGIDLSKTPASKWPMAAQSFLLAGAFAPPGLLMTAPRSVQVNTGAFIPPRQARTINLHLGPVPTHLVDAAAAPKAPAPAASSRAPLILAGGAAVLGAAAWNIPAAKAAILRALRRSR